MQHNETLKDFIKYVYHCTLKFITAHITPKIKKPDIVKSKSSNYKNFFKRMYLFNTMY